jgi:hypothetical protein
MPVIRRDAEPPESTPQQRWCFIGYIEEEHAVVVTREWRDLPEADPV